MKYYLTTSFHEVETSNSLCIEILPTAIFMDVYYQLPHLLEFSKERTTTYCRVLPFDDCVVGTFAIPDKKDVSIKHIFHYYITKQSVIFIDDQGFVDSIIKSMSQNKKSYTNTIGHFLHDFIHQLMFDDTSFLQSLEDTLTKIEETLLIEENKQLIDIRKRLTILSSYYHQLDDLVNILADNETNFFEEKECAIFKLQLHRIDRLYDHIFSMKEYSLQIKEMYQARIDAHQNKVVNVLTITTSIFFPLSIITGWYGMNFVNMPELYLDYGYLIVIILSILVVVVEWIILKRKKYV